MDLNYEQYRMAIDAAEKVTDRRNEFNKFFITILTLLIAAFGLFFKDPASNYLLYVILLIIGIKACSIWKKQLEYFKKLIKIKYKTVKEMEKEFGFRETHGMQSKKIKEYKSDKIIKSFTDQEKELANLFQYGFVAYLVIISIFFLYNSCFIKNLIFIIYHMNICGVK